MIEVYVHLKDIALTNIGSNELRQLGLFDELTSLRRRVQEGTLDMPGKDLEKYQRGIWQAIGKLNNLPSLCLILHRNMTFTKRHLK
jgi:hypothetical protein